jgi:alkanesulfonate monooxygenase SsuD/methylene tetrahydromethanopterin reductase-like flavin-dependent oxidoreductase (luciferase family)
VHQSTTKPPSLGISLPIAHGMSPADLVALAQHADRAGLDAVGIGEYTSADAFALAAAIRPPR